MRAHDAQTFADIDADTINFYLIGGRYGITATATWGGGSVTFEVLAADGTTWLTAATALTADGTALVDLPPGQYRFAVATATAVYLNISAVPGE